VREGFGFGFRSGPSPVLLVPARRARKSNAHFFGEVSERRPWALKRADRPAAFAGRSASRFFVLLPLGYQSCLHGRLSYPISHILRRHPPLGRPKRKRRKSHWQHRAKRSWGVTVPPPKHRTPHGQ